MHYRRLGATGLQLSALSFAPLILVQPIGAIALVITTLLNARVSGHKPTRSSLFAIVLCALLGAVIATRHCHNEEKVRMLRERGYTGIAMAYSDSSADLPLLLAAREPVVVNPKRSRVEFFRRALPPGTPILNWGCRDRAGDPVRPS